MHIQETNLLMDNHTQVWLNIMKDYLLDCLLIYLYARLLATSSFILPDLSFLLCVSLRQSFT